MDKFPRDGELILMQYKSASGKLCKCCGVYDKKKGGVMIDRIPIDWGRVVWWGRLPQIEWIRGPAIFTGKGDDPRRCIFRGKEFEVC